MNAAELKANPRLTKHIVTDLNKDPKLSSLASDSFDAVLCTVSIDYLIRVSITLEWMLKMQFLGILARRSLFKFNEKKIAFARGSFSILFSYFAHFVFENQILYWSNAIISTEKNLVSRPAKISFADKEKGCSFVTSCRRFFAIFLLLFPASTNLHKTRRRQQMALWSTLYNVIQLILWFITNQIGNGKLFGQITFFYVVRTCVTTRQKYHVLGNY